MKHYKLFIFYCLFLNVSNCHSDMKKSWLSTKNQLAPNLAPDLPKFTPFNNDEDDDSIIIDHKNNDSNNQLIDDNNNKLNGEQYQTEEQEEEEDEEEYVKKYKDESFPLNKDDESFIDKLLPFSDYIYDMYVDNVKKSKNKKHKKPYKKHHAEKQQEQNHDDDIGNEFTTEPIKEDDESATTLIDLDDENLSENTAADDNTILIEDDQSTETIDTDWNHKQNKQFSQYNVGPGVNVSLDVSNEVVRVQLDENCLKDVFTGRGKKKELITKTLALFILPFLIQTSFVPFLLSTIKLMLVNSVIVGKIAILLFLIALFKNHKLSNVQDPMPYYLDTSHNLHHHRRSETNNKGYLAVGKPETYIT